MSQPQMQHRPTMINVVSRRRGDRDLVNRPESFRTDLQNYRPLQPARSFTSNPGTESSGQTGHQHLNHPDSDNIGYVGGSRPAGDRGEAFPQGGSRGGEHDRPLNERLIFMTACLIGQPVEVQVKNGSIYSGIFHTANAENDYGVVLKMARLTGSVKAGKTEVAKDSARRAPVKMFIIPPKDLVQIIAKDVPLSGDILQNGRARENRAEIVTDSFLSQGRLGELERELKPWTPDKDDPKDLGLESTFQSSWNRNWDQFKINRALFGVESTFDEEIYTTRLDKGPQMKEREREAWRIAREIEGQSTKNVHLAEERGVRMTKDMELLDDESRFSSVLQTNDSMDVGEENDDVNIDVHNDETFRNSFEDIDSGSIGSTEIELSVPKMGELEFGMSRASSADLNEAGESPHQSPIGRSSSSVSPLIVDMTSIQALNLDPGCPQVTEEVYREFNEFKQQENAKRGKKQREDQVNELKSFSESLKDLTKDLEPRSPKLSSKNVSAEDGARAFVVVDSKPSISSVGVTTSSNAVTTGACTLPASALPIATNVTCSINTLPNSDAMISTPGQGQPTTSSIAFDSARLLAGGVTQLELPSTSGAQPSSASNIEAPSSPMHSTASTTAPSSPSSLSGVSGGAASSKKSFLNPNAKEFRLNPNAKSFTPTFTPVRPPSPVVQGPVYVPGGMPPGAQMQGMPMGVGVNPLLQQPGQQASKFTPYNSMPLAAASSAAPFVQPPGTYTPGVSGAGVPPSLPGQTTLKIPPQQVQQPVVGNSFGSQPPIRYTSQAPPVQAAPTYLHPNMQLYSQQMMFGQPGQVVYIQPYPQGPPMPPPQPAQASSQQNQQPKHRGGGVQGMQFCIAPPFLGGQQHFLQQVQLPHLHNPLQPTPGVLAPTTMPGIQPPQSVVAGMVPTIQNAGNLPGNNTMRLGGKITGGNFQQ